MPRRPSKKTAGKPRSVNRSDAKIKKWNKASDVPMDEEDEFHASRDKILLEGNEIGGDDDGDDDEVFGLDLSDEEELGDDENEDEDVPAANLKSKSSKSKSKKAKAQAKAKGKGSSSEEEDEEDEDEAWGRGRSAYYSSNAAQLDSDDEEGNELEEQEAKRLQTKSRDAMDDDDFGLDDAVEAITIEAPEDSTPTEDPTPQDPKSLLRQLEKTSPETLALARDWEDTAESLIKTREKIAKLEAKDPDSLSLGMIHLYYQTELTYTTALAFYLHLRSSEKYARRPDLLRTHPVLERLLTLKQSLITLEDLDFAASDSEDGSNDDSSDVDVMMDAQQLWRLNRMEGLDEDELDELLHDADMPEKEVEMEAEAEMRPKKKRKTSQTSPALPVFDLVEPEFTSSTSAQHRHDSSTDAYGEVTALQHADAADKTARRKTLRFHTSRIESASARRQGARNNAAGGDDDIPYRDTRKQAPKVPQNSRGQGGEDLDESEPQPKTSDADAEDADGYYELVNRKSKLKKELKKAEYEAAQEAARPDYEQGGADGPRSLTRAILTNKGLTPRRPKSVRNPRVKKREKFRKANMKMSSQKAIYKGGLAATGRYEGEKSGISKVVKSIPLS
ncbi:Sas10 C-terminal domain-containing protein [Mycena haematopus]|nr:Sas10 C-terminal domain-containing protein [Mycena haematopus]